MTVNQIIKRTFERLKKEDKLMTPDFYAEAFCKEAKAAGIIVEDCNQVDKFTKKLDKSIQDELKQYSVRNMNELITFFISKLNRTKENECNAQNRSLNALLRRVLQTISSLHNAELSALSSKSIKDLSLVSNADQIEKIKEEWIGFLTTYDDSFLDVLKPYTKLNKHDIKKSLETLHVAAVSDEGEYEELALLFIASFVPSIAPALNDTLAGISDEIRRNPQSLNSATMIASIKEAIKERVKSDRDHVREMVHALDEVLEKLSVQILVLINQTDQSGQEIQIIKKHLENLELADNDDFKSAHKKLYTIASSLEEETLLLGSELKEHNNVVKEMEERINKLESELAEAKKASREDALTKLPNKRAIDEYLEIKEAEFKRYNKPYSIVFFDIDFFKKVNDTYGHKAGDVVLRGFAKVIKSVARNVDFVGRNGGEEFLAILSHTDREGAKVFANKVREKVEKSRFLYAQKKISVTISGGIAYREEHSSKDTTLKAADDRLYKAKEGGRNQIM